MTYEFEVDLLVAEMEKLQEKIQDLEVKNRELKTDYEILKREFDKTVESQFYMG